MAAPKFVWTAFYSEFADRLLEYRSGREELVRKIKKVYADIGMKLPKLEADNDRLRDMDPFTVFGLFNKGITDQTRIKIIRGLAGEFNLRSKIPDSFPGVPVLNNLSATFYRFENDEHRGEHDIDHLWDVFACALSLAEEDSTENRERFCAAFDRALAQTGIRWNITMGLFWIRPYRYLNLDSRNRWFMQQEGKMPAEFAESISRIKNTVPQASEYLKLTDDCLSALTEGAYPYRDFPSLSSYAWDLSEEINRQDAEQKLQKSGESNSLGDADVDTVRYWLYTPGRHAAWWEDCYRKGIAVLGWNEVGDLKNFENKEELRKELHNKLGGDSSYGNSANALWQFANVMKPGDVLFIKCGHSEVLGKGIVDSDYEYDGSQPEFPHVRRVRWTHKGEWNLDENFPVKTLTEITNDKGLTSKLLALFEAEVEEEPEAPAVSYPTYTADDFLEEVYINEEDYSRLTDLLVYKKNIILQGPPGVGKTFIAKRLAYSMMGEKDVDRVQLVQFHQSYSYEDFIMGFRPTAEGGFELKKGVFYTFCKKAMEDSEREYFFIIDEINRGNLSRIFGELFMLIEADKRGSKNKIQLLYADELFYVPENVYIIGMMNTADRSLAMLDYALRRRFAFFDLRPAFSSDGFRRYQKDLDNPEFDRLAETVEQLNEDISLDETLGDGFCIGHSYFCNMPADSSIDERLSNLVEYELIPLLKEYWFDEPGKVREWSGRLRSALQ